MRTIKTRILEMCPVCGSDRLRQIQTGFDFETGTGEYDIVECGSCGIDFTNPQPLEVELPRLYMTRTSSDFPKVNALTRLLRTASINREVARVMRDIRGESLNALEYGCGDGAFAISIAEHPRIRLITAVDFHNEPPRLFQHNASTRKLEYVSAAEFEKRSIQVHIAFLRHVLEHSFEPETMLKQIWASLHPGGVLVINVPNFESLGRRIFGRNYFALYLPRHLYHFRIPSLRTLVGRYFRIVSVAKTHTPVWGKSLGNMCRVNIPNTGLTGIGTFPLQIFADMIAGTSSVITLIAQKDS